MARVYREEHEFFVIEKSPKSFVVKETKIHNVKNCLLCPHCYTGKTFGNDGRDGGTTYLCEKKAFGNKGKGNYEGYAKGLDYSEVATNIHHLCPTLIDYRMEEELRAMSVKYGKRIGVVTENLTTDMEGLFDEK